MSKAVKKSAPKKETDNVYFLKILIYFLLGLIWVKFNGYVVFPLGLVLGIIIAQKDHFSIDRKVEYGILIVAAMIGASFGGFYLSFWAK